MTREELAAVLEVTPRTVSNWPAEGCPRARRQPPVQLDYAGFLVEAGHDDRKTGHQCRR